MRLPLPGLALAHQLYLACAAQGHSERGTQALVLAVEAAAGRSWAAGLADKQLQQQQQQQPPQ